MKIRLIKLVLSILVYWLLSNVILINVYCVKYKKPELKNFLISNYSI